MTPLDNRRPLKSRNAGWAKSLAAMLARAGVKPDVISAGSVVFAASGGAMLVLSGMAVGVERAVLALLAGVCVQLRLICNLLDGMVALEHRRGGPYGPIWNELPDRFADLFLLVGAGYGAQLAGAPGAGLIGWIAASLAVLTAYVRELGRGLGFAADFCGPMAKPQRMAVLTAACLLTAIEPVLGWSGLFLALGLAVIALGGAITLLRRILRLATRLRERAAASEKP